MRITIIGAGFTGSLLATLLASSRDDAPDVALVGVAESHGRGVAYGMARPEHLLNVRARHLGADPENPHEFAEWLNLSARALGAFLPRVAYGEYLADRLRASRALASNLTSIEREAIAVDRRAGGFRVHLADGQALDCERVVIAVGALPPQRLAGVGPRLARDARYVGWPWGDDALERIPAQASVLVVGTGLTMADVVATLHRRGHAGPITAISRRGLLPARHMEEAAEPVALPPNALRALAHHDLRALVRALRPLARIAPNWRSVVDALRPHTQAFWAGLDAPQQRMFLRHLRPHWDALRHRLAPQTAALLDHLLIDGQLETRAARLLRASLRDDRVDVLLRDRGSVTARLARYDFLVRATGLDTDIARTTDPLLQHLREAGLVSADPLGLGVRADAHGTALDTHGEPVRGLSVIGPLLRGQSWEITAVPELRVAAARLARRLARAEPGERGDMRLGRVRPAADATAGSRPVD